MVFFIFKVCSVLSMNTSQLLIMQLLFVYSGFIPLEDKKT